jgi:hypothetical protein
MSNTEKLISKHKAYALLDISRDALKSLCDAGIIKFKVVDGRGTRKYKLSSINEFLSE